jgi:sugar/nucleoside kinase (ribokinase family)
VTKIIVVGDIVTDIVAVVAGPIAHGSDTSAAIVATGGGGGANTAAWLAAAGVDVTLCGVVGDDDAGDIRLAELEVRGVTCSVRREPDAATGSIVVLANGAERTMLTDRGANERLTADDVDAALASARDAVHLHLSGYALLDTASRPAALHALSAAAERGLTTSVDAASAGPLRQVGGQSFLEWVRATDALFVNVDEARALLDTGESDPSVLARSLARWCGIAIVKLGPAGATSYIVGSREVVSVTAPEVQALDATGAGDAFAAGYLAAWLAGASGGDALSVGAEMGALAVSSIGARPIDS